MIKAKVETGNAPPAIGPYSQGIVFHAGTLVVTAGQIPFDAGTGTLVAGGIEAQTRKALENCQAVLKAAGSGLEHAVKTTVFLKDMNDFPQMNRVYETFFSGIPPARSTVEAARLPKDVLVEIECMAVVPEK